MPKLKTIKKRERIFKNLLTSQKENDMLGSIEVAKNPNFKPESLHVVKHGGAFASSDSSQAFLFGGNEMKRLKLTRQQYRD